MRRLYVLPKHVWEGTIQVGTHQHADGSSEPVMVETTRLFNPAIGAHYIDLPKGMILMMASFDHSEMSEDIFHAHPEVAILPHPTVSGKVMLKDHITSKDYKFTQAHLDALTSNNGFGIKDTDTVLDVARKAAAIHPEVRFRNVL